MLACECTCLGDAALSHPVCFWHSDRRSMSLVILQADKLHQGAVNRGNRYSWISKITLVDHNMIWGLYLALH